MPTDLDHFDQKILQILQGDASLPITEIASQVGLSTAPCWRRIKRLTETGVLVQQVAHLDHEKLGLNMIVFAEVKLAGHGRQAVPNFQKEITQFPEVLECYAIMGEIDYLLKITTVDIHTYEKFLHQLLAMRMVGEVNSRMVMSVAKCTTALPLELSQHFTQRKQS